jgi:hypothetical protein
MEIAEIVMYTSLGFIPTLLALEASWKLAMKRRLGIKTRSIAKVPEIGIR